MSMTVLTILQFVSVFCVYSFLSFGLPAFVLRGKLQKRKRSERWLIYFTVGNFFMMNLVFLLQLLHISNRFTLLLFTAAPVLWVGIKESKGKLWEAIRQEAGEIRKLLDGRVGLRLFLTRRLSRFGKWIVSLLGRALRFVGAHLPDVLLLIGAFALLWWVYGQNLITNYGYCASDIPVHNYWINYMSKGQIFVAGVYPFGFHCIIYYLHAVFGFETYVLLRVFCFVQTVLIHFVLLLVLRACCRSKFAPYIGLAFYAGTNFFVGVTYTRYYSSLPQEFGMLFILPSVYFLFVFFKERKAELDALPEEASAAEAVPTTPAAAPAVGDAVEEKKRTRRWKRLCARLRRANTLPNRMLALFAMSFSMTLAVHFYGTMIAGVFCLGIAIGFSFLLFRKAYFGRVMLAGILSIVIAVLPMGIAYATGTPLQGSLNWGMKVINGELEDDDATAATSAEESDSEDTSSKSQAVSDSEQAEKTDADGNEANTDGQSVQTQETVESNGFLSKIKQKATSFISVCNYMLRTYITSEEAQDFYWLIYVLLGALLVLGIVLLFFGERHHAGMLLSTVFALLFLLFLLISGELGLPELMQAGRVCIYFAYILPVALGFLVDGLLVLFVRGEKRARLRQALSAAALGLFGIVIVCTGFVRQARRIEALETNEAVTCLTNIIKDNEDFNWTIVSANDEYRMGEDYGWHYELSEFLLGMEGSGKWGSVLIPTQYVYFFVEKVPVDYTASYEGSGQRVSKKGAENSLWITSNLEMYMGEKRWIMMSRMYYWAQAFQKLYPNELKVYYETDDFVCYYVEQNTYRVYNFAIDYGYNVITAEEE